MSSPSRNPRKRRFSPSTDPRLGEEKRSRVSDRNTGEKQSVPSPKAVSPTQSSQDSATAQTPRQKECSNDDLTQAAINLITIKEKIEDTLELLKPFMPVLHDSKPSRAQ